MRQIYLPLLFGAISYASFAQDLKKLGIDSNWNKGTIQLEDGSKLTGLVRFNDKEGIITYSKLDDDTNGHMSFRENKVSALEYYDEDIHKNRKFYALPYKDKESTKEVILLYEIIMEFKNFAVVARKIPTQILQRKDADIESSLLLSQLERIYFIDEEGYFELYLLINEQQLDTYLGDFAGTKKKIVDKDILSKYTGQHWPAVKKYAVQNKLKLKRKEDLVKVLAYYKELSEL